MSASKSRRQFLGAIIRFHRQTAKDYPSIDGPLLRTIHEWTGPHRNRPDLWQVTDRALNHIADMLPPEPAARLESIRKMLR